MHMEYYPEVVQAIPTKDYKVYAYFDDGRIKLYDASELVSKGIFKQLTEGDLFIKSCTILNGTVAWTPDFSYDPETCLDLDPTNIYNTCPTVDEPEEIFSSSRTQP